jgi:hypothetical protein
MSQEKHVRDIQQQYSMVLITFHNHPDTSSVPENAIAKHQIRKGEEKKKQESQSKDTSIW